MASTVSQVRAVALQHTRRIIPHWPWILGWVCASAWAYAEGGIPGMWAAAALTAVFPVINALQMMSLVSDVGMRFQSGTLASHGCAPGETAALCAQCSFLFFLDFVGTALEFMWSAFILLVLDSRWQPGRSAWRYAIVVVTTASFLWEAIQHLALVPALMSARNNEDISAWRQLLRAVNSFYLHFFRQRRRRSSTPTPLSAGRGSPVVFTSRSLDPMHAHQMQPVAMRVAVTKVFLHSFVFAAFLVHLGVALGSRSIGATIRAVEGLAAPNVIHPSHLNLHT